VAAPLRTEARSPLIRHMQAITIDAASEDSARSLLEVLSAFDAELVDSPDGGRQVVVPLTSDRRIVDVLNALERYVSERANGPARLELEGRRYTLHPEHEH
jgi:hypothetical protein